MFDKMKTRIFGDKENIGILNEVQYITSNIRNAIKSPELFTGNYGEYLTEYKIEKNLTGYYRMFKNVYIPYQNKNGENKTTEIDIIIIHEKGIFVIESKNYSGWIFGNEKQKTWTQCLPNKTKTQFYNPIKQNQAHISILSRYIKIGTEKMKSIIVFSERCELKKVPNNCEQYTITKRENFTKVIQEEIAKNNTVFTKEQIDFFSNEIQKLTNVSEEVKQQHIKDIKN